MALVEGGSIKINGQTVTCTKWSIKGGPESEGKYGVGGVFIGKTKKVADYEIEVEILQEKGKPRIDFDAYAASGAHFTLTRNYEGGARHQFANAWVSSASEEDADADGNYTRKIMMRADGNGKLEQ